MVIQLKQRPGIRHIFGMPQQASMGTVLLNAESVLKIGAQPRHQSPVVRLAPPFRMLDHVNRRRPTFIDLQPPALSRQLRWPPSLQVGVKRQPGKIRNLAFEGKWKPKRIDYPGNKRVHTGIDISSQ